jgi:hypothetical protein
MEEVLLSTMYDGQGFEVDPIATITYYQGKPDIYYIENRVREIINANPWLESRLIQRHGNYLLQYPKQPANKSFMVAYKPELKYDMQSCEEIGEVLEPYRIKRGKRLFLGRDEPMFRIVLFIINEDIFGIFLSISHGIADGTTRYQLYGMLDESRNVRSLNPHRYVDFEKKSIALCGEDAKNWATSIALIINFVWAFFFGKTTRQCTKLLSKPHIQALKNAFSDGQGRLVSSNDVICSKIFNAYRTDVGAIALNFRSKRTLEDLTIDMAGNYAGVLIVQQQDFLDPLDLRSSIQQLRRSKSSQLPGFWRTLFSQITIMTNWTSLYQHVDLSGCEQLLHTPVFYRKTVVIPNYFLVFNPNHDQLAIMLFSKSMPTLLSHPAMKELGL